MENNGVSCSSTVNNIIPQQSQWLQQTSSDLNKRMGVMMDLLEEDKNSSARTDIYQAKRLKLFHMLEEFRDSYRYLAEKYDQLRSKLLHVTDLGSIPSSSSNSSNLELFNSRLDSIMEDPGVECGNTNHDFEYLNKLIEELTSTEQSNMKMKYIEENQCKEETAVLCNKKGINITMNYHNLLQDQITVGDPTEGNFEGDSWSELEFQVSKLMEENLQQQAELARRNIEKTVIINRLKLQLKHLKDENRAIQGYISCLNAGENHSQFQKSKLKKLVSGKFFRLGCS